MKKGPSVGFEAVELRETQAASPEEYVPGTEKTRFPSACASGFEAWGFLTAGVKALQLTMQARGLETCGKTGALSTVAGLDAAAVGGQPLSVGQQLDVGGHVSQVSFGQRDHTAAP